MGAGHDHHHDHGPADYSRAFLIGIVLNVAFVIVEAVFGFLADSMALVADAGHNLTDVLGLVVAWAGATLARRSPSQRFTYGLKKASILAALINAVFLLVAVGAIAAEAIRRLFNPAPTEGATVMIVAAAGVLVNGVTAFLFSRGREADLNIRGAFQHMAADAVVSAAVVFAGAIILLTGQHWVDPVMGLAVAVVILWGSVGLLKESVGMTLAGVPSGIELDAVEAALATLPGVEAVHDLHVWALSTTETALTAHLIAPSAADDALLRRARAMLHDQFHIDHCTIQIERAFAAGCADC
jgi:cobalt-zinc-cadmium efflux system protein